ncbi:MAG TPA: hypothetical protein VHD87_12835 [Acidimicrobiales bacterium]|nr:hypothetical protein [Acidimicrobiales bacterium]
MRRWGTLLVGVAFALGACGSGGSHSAPPASVSPADQAAAQACDGIRYAMAHPEDPQQNARAAAAVAEARTAASEDAKYADLPVTMQATANDLQVEADAGPISGQFIMGCDKVPAGARTGATTPQDYADCLAQHLTDPQACAR